MAEQVRFMGDIRVQKERTRVLEEARLWLGTPFHHGKCVRGAGVDCAHLLVGVYSGAGVAIVDPIERYGRDWFLHERTDRLVEILQQHCVATDDPAPGDIAVFRFGRMISHAAIILNYPYIIHADRTAGRVIEDRCASTDSLGSRLAGWYTLQRWVGGR